MSTDEDMHGPWDKEQQRYEDGCKSGDTHQGDTATITLASFLLDRIAEDEAVAHSLHDYAECDKARHALDDPTFGWECTCDYPTRVLADCAAKRRIVEWCGERERVFIGRVTSNPDREEMWAPGQYKHPEDSPVLRMLAAPYADHPDYREEWR